MDEPKTVSAASAESFRDSRLASDLLWRDLRIERSFAPMPALFLDRDGVMIEEKEYLDDPSEVELLPGVCRLIRAARDLGMAVVQITNQAGIAHGLFDWSDFVRVEDRLTELLASEGEAVDAIFACPFHPEGQHPFRASEHPWRKPKPGMFLEAQRLLNIDPQRSIVVGDKVTDLQGARSAGLAGGVHVLTGHGREHEAASRSLDFGSFPVYVVARADEAIPFLSTAACGVNGPLQ
jgi:D-glycero-D-manno-heptose 1,7-bisphosphate phosphatase